MSDDRSGLDMRGGGAPHVSYEAIDLIVSLPYNERAARAIIAAAHHGGGSSRTFRESSWIKAVDGLSSLVNARRQSDDGHHSQSVHTFGAMARRAARLTRSKYLDLAGMYFAKTLFDRAVGRRVSGAHGVLIGFPGASLSTFSNFSGVKVFHAVDAHPRSHNYELLSHYSRSECRAELYPLWLVKRIEKELNLADVVLVPSLLVKRQMISHGVSEQKITVEPYGVDFELFAKEPVEVPDQDRDRDRPCVVYVGQISRRKGIGFLLEAATGLNVDVILVGNAFDASVLRKIPDNVTVRSSVSHTELAEILARCDAFVIPTIEDACSLVVLEAAAAGLPVITTTMNGAAEILPEEVTELIAAGNVDELRNALRTVDLLSGHERSRNRELTRSGKVRDWSTYGTAIVTSLSKMPEGRNG
jgi:glycosyltransferase involved in cell wall biosynthesis